MMRTVVKSICGSCSSAFPRDMMSLKYNSRFHLSFHGGEPQHQLAQ
jgi:hypothetical protein